MCCSVTFPLGRRAEGALLSSREYRQYSELAMEVRFLLGITCLCSPLTAMVLDFNTIRGSAEVSSSKKVSTLVGAVFQVTFANSELQDNKEHVTHYLWTRKLCRLYQMLQTAAKSAHPEIGRNNNNNNKYTLPIWLGCPSHSGRLPTHCSVILWQ